LDHDTYDRRIQLGASRRRREDSAVLHQAARWAGAIYLGGYAIECALKALICYNERTNNLKETRLFNRMGGHGNTLHDLAYLLRAAPSVQRAIVLDSTNAYRQAWDTITQLWQKDELRYWDKLGDRQDSERFIAAVQTIHRFLLDQQGEVS